MGGAIAGILDITYAFLFYGARGIPPIRILQSIASGLFGAESYRGGINTAILGAQLHFLIAFVVAAIYYLASRTLPVLIRRAAACGLLYGVIIYFFMNLVVLPLSAFPHKIHFVPLIMTTGLLVHMFFIGLPIALAARHYQDHA